MFEDLVVIKDNVKLHTPNSMYGKILRYMLPRRNEWIGVSELCLHTGSKNNTSVGTRMNVLSCDYEIEYKKSQRTTWYKLVGKIPVTKTMYDIVNIVADCGDWMCSFEISKLVGISSYDVGAILNYLCQPLNIERKILSNHSSIYRYVKS